MADEYQSTDRLSEDTAPETPRLLAEGTITITSADFGAVTGGFLGTGSADISQINDIGNNVKDAFATYKVEVWQGYSVINKFDVFRALPFVKFTNYSTGQVDRWAEVEIYNDGTAGGGIFTSTITVNYFADTSGTDRDDAGFTQSFYYKVWSVPFPS